MMMKSVFWWRKPEYPEETTDLRQVTGVNVGVNACIRLGALYDIIGLVLIYISELDLNKYVCLIFTLRLMSSCTLLVIT